MLCFYCHGLVRLFFLINLYSRGYAAKKGESAFRKWFGRINEIRSIVGKVPLVALTATATKSTRLKIMRSLEMREPALLMDSPNRQHLLRSQSCYPRSSKNFSNPGQGSKKTESKLLANHYMLSDHQSHHLSVWIFCIRTWG